MTRQRHPEPSPRVRPSPRGVHKALGYLLLPSAAVLFGLFLDVEGPLLGAVALPRGTFVFVAPLGFAYLWFRLDRFHNDLAIEKAQSLESEAPEKAYAAFSVGHLYFSPMPVGSRGNRRSNHMTLLLLIPLAVQVLSLAAWYGQASREGLVACGLALASSFWIGVNCCSKTNCIHREINRWHDLARRAVSRGRAADVAKRAEREPSGRESVLPLEGAPGSELGGVPADYDYAD